MLSQIEQEKETMGDLKLYLEEQANFDLTSKNGQLNFFNSYTSNRNMVK